MSQKIHGFRTSKCGRCGKAFIPAPQHIYKDNGKSYCSWTCFNHRNDYKVQGGKAYENNKN